ncbi:Peroxidasin-like protein [Eumeta japonica]|uniref:Peroxidasin-like protein n=1 Tax=Eumeta variegata TaxID=151549 RepID=A0A4C1T0U1_EUMVA|nr:Peroxidasin-like protein [Eumeta japonica]
MLDPLIDVYINDVLSLYSATGESLGQRTIVDDTLRTGILDFNGTLEGLTQAAFRQPSAAADRLLDPDMGERVLGRLQRVSDVVASDIMKGRDLGIPPYNSYRELCGRAPAEHWSDLLDVMDSAEISTLRGLYATPADVELAVALLVERLAAGTEVPPTLACIMLEQLRHWRRADRFWYENNQHPGSFTRIFPKAVQRSRWTPRGPRETRRGTLGVIKYGGPQS